ncbi:MAG: NYN domain-containing protein [Chloroflexi bacterium]|nr:NYN domain-containing protein [Chloroflexota bacterium]
MDNFRKRRNPSVRRRRHRGQGHWNRRQRKARRKPQPRPSSGLLGRQSLFWLAPEHGNPLPRIAGFRKNLTAHHTDDYSESAMIEHSGDIPERTAAGVSAIYVDTENLTPPAGEDDVNFAQDLISLIVSDWPTAYPPIGLLALYVPADKTSQWRTWASALPPVQQRGLSSSDMKSWRDPILTQSRERLRVRGVQHFTRNGSKNSADLAIVLDVMDDLLLSQRADFVAVLSNDSDFYALFDKLYEIVTDRGGHPVSKIPLLWVVAPNGNNLSPEIKRFLLPQFIWDLSEESASSSVAHQVANQHQELGNRTSDDHAGVPDDVGASASKGQLAISIVRELAGKGEFKSSVAHDIAKRFFPSLPEVNCDGPQFGMYLGDVLWPLIAEYGGRKSKPTPTSSWVYEIPETATSEIPTVPSDPESIAS